MHGDKEDPLVIGRSKTPRGFKTIDFKSLGLKYQNYSKSWRTSKIFREWLSVLNKKLLWGNGKILLALENASVYNISLAYSNIELFYLPPNTTSKVQALDQGIIHSFKANYRRLFTRDITLKGISSDKCYTTLDKNFKLFNSLTLILDAWKEVSEDTIRNCF